MAKVAYPLFLGGIGCLGYKPQKNLKGKFTHTVSVRKIKKGR